MRGRFRQRGRGIALVLVLWVLALLTIMALSVTATQRTEVALTENLVANVRFRAASDAAIAYMVASFMMPADELPAAEAAGDADAIAMPWVPNGAARDWGFFGQKLSISVTDEQSRINLNESDPELLAALIALFDVPEEEARAIADAIADFRDEDDLTQLNGAEDGDYADAGLALGAKDEAFVAVEELQQVLGMTRELYRGLSPEVTVDTEGGEIREKFASPAVLAALQGISIDDAKIQVEERDDPLLAGIQGPAAVDRGGPLYRVRVKSEGAGRGGGGVRIMEALVEIAAGQTPPYIVRWRRFGLLEAAPPADSTAEPDAEEP